MDLNDIITILVVANLFALVPHLGVLFVYCKRKDF